MKLRGKQRHRKCSRPPPLRHREGRSHLCDEAGCRMNPPCKTLGGQLCFIWPRALVGWRASQPNSHIHPKALSTAASCKSGCLHAVLVQIEQLEERLRAAESAAAAAAASGSSVASSAAASAAAEEQLVQLRQRLAASRTQVGWLYQQH